MTYLSTILADSPANYWRMADAQGSHSYLDLIAGEYLRDIGQPAWSGYSGPNTDGGSALLTNVIAGLLKGTFTLPQSLEAWFFFGDFQGESYVMSYGGPGGGDLNMGITAAGVIGNALPTGGTGSVSHSLSVTAWHHLVWVVHTAAWELYIDGSQVATASGAVNNTARARTVFLGQRGAGTLPWHGFVSEVAIYSAALTSAQVSAHYAAADQPTVAPVGANRELDLILQRVTNNLPSLP